MRAKRLILASGSPRRRELLAKMGYEFLCKPADVDENIEGDAAEVVKALARRKARAAIAGERECVVIASDTLVSLEGAGLGKPLDAADARRMLRLLSGREHDVFTGVCVIDADTGREQTRLARTGVKFRELSDDEISAYVATGEPMDKAGAYAIQGLAGAFVEKLDGAFENVMGFPVDVVGDMLKDFMAGE